MKWFLYIIALILAIAGYSVVSTRDIEEPVGAEITPVQTALLESEEPLFAEIDAQGTVLRVIVADQAFIDSGAVGDPKNWIRTSAKGTIRKNAAGIGYTYDSTLDAFIPPKTAETTEFNTEKAIWEYPVVTKTMQEVATSTDI